MMVSFLRWTDFNRNELFHVGEAPGVPVRSHRHDFWELMLVEGSGGTHVLNGTAHEMTPGHIWLVRPDDVHSIASHGRLKFVNVAFPASRFAAWCECVGLQAEFKAWEADAAPKIARAPELDSLFHELKRQFFADRPRLLELCALWNQVARRLVPAPALLPHGAPFWMEAALQRVQDDDAPGAKALALAAGVSASHLAREWKRVFGASPTAWLNARRLERAATLLLTTDLPVARVGERCGFENPAYFSRLFERKFGVAPRAYRQRLFAAS